MMQKKYIDNQKLRMKNNQEKDVTNINKKRVRQIYFKIYRNVANASIYQREQRH